MSAFNTNLLENIDIVVGVPPADFNSDQAGDYVSLKNYDGCLVVVTKAAGTAGDDISLQLYQATDVSGTSEKALSAIRAVYYKVGTQTAVGAFTKLAMSATADYDTAALTTGGVQGLFVVNVRASDLDVDNNFDCLCFKNDGTDLSSACNGTVHYILYGARYPGVVPVAAITD